MMRFFQKIFMTLTLFSLITMGILSSSAQNTPNNAQPPDEHTQYWDLYDAFIPAHCDGYDVLAESVADLQVWRWYNEDGSVAFSIFQWHEDVVLTNTFSGKSVNVFLRFRAEVDILAENITLVGIRTSVVRDDGGLDVYNVGRIEIAGLSSFKGDVLSAAGHWDAITNNVFDHRDFACQLVAD